MTPEARACDERIRQLYGEGLERDAGNLHVLALWKAPDGPPRIIRIDAHAPQSATDLFALHLTRARADVVVTSGSILRAEPKLVHEIGVSNAMRRELRAWRREVTGRSEPPQELVLTRGRDLDLDHPLLRAPSPCILYTGQAAAAELEPLAQARGIRVVARPAPSPRDALAWLRERTGAKTIALELGVRASAPLYEEPLAVDELLLSLYLEPDLPEAQQGAPFFELTRLASHFDTMDAPVVRHEASGRWSFRRLRRKRGI